LHFNLHSPLWGMYIVGIAGMFMLIAILTGIVIHKRIFKDFFTFRPKTGGQRAWLDGHNLTGVLGLPFHLMIAYTGVAIFVANYMPAGLNAAYNGDVEKFFVEAADSYERPETGKALKTIYPVDKLVADARQRLGQPITWVSVHHPNDTSATISFGGDHSRNVAWNFDSVFYDANDGKFLHQSGAPQAGYKTYTFLGGMHMAQWGGSALRWLYFVMGLAGCVMIASGMQVWVIKRAKKIAEAGSDAVAFALIPLVNLATSPNSHLLATIARGDWSLAAVDLTALALGAGFALLARNSFVKARQPIVERKPRRAERGNESGNQPALADR
ncbi:MAG: PepSY domain-containing protein, partial [Lysobacter sp.]|nr:PepSY domain-containing protein [Lysobacter sp.]